MSVAIIKKIIWGLIKSTLIPFILNNMDKWTTVLNEKLQEKLEKLKNG
jgi:hypothetical protein